MQSDGLSLVGFLDQPSAMSYLTARCVFDDAFETPADHWKAAKARLGAPTPNPGDPEIQDMPREAQQSCIRWPEIRDSGT